MNDGLYMNIKLDYFERDMKQLAGPIAKKIEEQALRAGAQFVLEALQEAAPERPDLPSGTALPVGAIRDDLRARISKQDDGTLLARIGPGPKTRHVCVWVEYGHFSRSRERQLIGGNLESKWVPSHPWIRPVYEACHEEAAAVVGEVLETEIANEAARLGYVA